MRASLPSFIRTRYKLIKILDAIFFSISCGAVPGPQSMAFSCFPDSKSHILIWLSSELDAATAFFGQGLYHWDGYKLADITVTRARLHDLHNSERTC